MKPKSVRLIEQLESDAPDRHAALQRLSLQTGLPLESFDDPSKLTDEQTEAVEEAVKRILGVDELEG